MITAKDFIITLFTPTYVDSVPIFRINLILLPLMCIMVDPIGRAFAEVGSYLLKIRAVLFLLLSASLWLVIDDLNMFEVIGLVVTFIVIESFTVWKCLKLEVSRSDVRLLKTFSLLLSRQLSPRYSSTYCFIIFSSKYT